MYNKKRKQKNALDKEFQEDIKQVKSLLNDAKNIVERGSCEDDFNEALQMLNKAINKAASVQVSNTYHLYYYRGICYLNLKELEKAERDFIESSSLADEKGKVQIYACLGRCKVEMGEEDPSYFDEAIKCYEKAIEFSKNTDSESYLKLANIHTHLGNREKAIQFYTAALDCSKPLKLSQQYEALRERGLCYRQIGQLENSIVDFTKGCDLNKDEPSIYFNLGLSYLLNEKYEIAQEKLEMAIELNSMEPQYKNFKGLAMYLNGQYENCLYVFRSTLKLYNQKEIRTAEVGECWYNLGNALLQMSQDDEALIAFTMALNFEISQDQRLKVYYAQGLALEAKKSIEAIKKFEESWALVGNNKSHSLYLSTLYHLGVNERIHRKYISAINHVNLIVQTGCNQKCVYELKGKIYLDYEKYDLALKDFETLLSLDPTYPEAYYYLGMAKTNLGDVEAGIVDFFKAIDMGSKNVRLMNGISYAYLKGGKPDKALVYINMALEKQPNEENFLIQRSMVYIELKENHRAIQDLTKAVGINSKNAFTYYRRGISYYKNEQYEEAIGDLKKSLEFEPSQQIKPDIYYLMGVSYSNLKDFQAAKEPFSRAIELGKLPKYYHERAKCHILLDENNEALKDLNEVISQQPKNAFAYFRRALAFKALKQYEDAAEDLMKARQISPDDPKLIVNKKQIYELKFRELCRPGEEA